MPWALTNREDGVRPSARYVHSEDSAPQGAVVVDDEEYYAAPMQVWDATNKKLRVATEAEAVEHEKPIRRRALLSRMDARMGDIFPIRGEHASVARRRPNDDRVRRADALMDQADDKVAAIDAATTWAELDAVKEDQ